MRTPALRYMVTRGIVFGTGAMMLFILLSSLFSDSGFSTVVMNSTNNNLLLVAAFYLVFSFLPGALLGGVGGGIIGFLLGLYTERFVDRQYENITDADEYARTLGLRTGGLSAVLAIAGMVLFFSSRFDVYSAVIVAMAALVAGFIGHRFAHYDMKQRREKKESAKESLEHYSAPHLELLDETEDLYTQDEESISEREVIR